MKRVFGYIFLIVGTVFTFAFTTVHVQPTFGVKGGVNLNYLKIEQDIKQEKIYPGLHLGIFSNIKIGKDLSFIPEMQFATRKYDLNIFGEDIVFGYLEVPLMLLWQPGKLISLEGGPYTAFKLYASSENETGYPKDAFTKFLDAGLAAEMRLHVYKNFAIVPRYYLGILPVADTVLRDETNQVVSGLKASNRTIQISVAWTFNRS